MTTLEQILLLLKYGGAIGAAAYGIYATVTDLHEHRGSKKVLSRKGYYGIALLTLSSVLSLSADMLTEHLQRREASERKQELVQHYESIIADLRQVRSEAARAANPIKDMRVSMCLQIPLQDPNLQGYRDRLQTDVPRLIREGRLSVSYPMTVHGPAQEVLFDRESSLFPTQNEQDAWHLMTTIEIDLNFYRVPRTSSDIRRQGYLESDLRIDLTERGMKDPPSRRAKVRYDIKTQKLLLCCSYDASEYRLSSTGRIVAVPDLAGVQVIITFKDIRYGRGSVNPRSKLEVESLYLSMSGGQHIQIRGGDLQKYEDRSGWPHYAYMLPGAKD